MDLLKQLNAVVHIKKKLLLTPLVKIPMIFGDDISQPPKHFQECFHVIHIPARTQQVVKIPVCYKNGLGLSDYTNFENNVEMPKAVQLFCL